MAIGCDKGLWTGQQITQPEVWFTWTRWQQRTVHHDRGVFVQGHACSQHIQPPQEVGVHAQPA